MQHKPVPLGELGVRSVTLLQDHNCVMHTVVCKVNLEVGPI